MGRLRALRNDLSSEIVGQQALIEELLIALLADGHLLVEGPSGWPRPARSGRWRQDAEMT